jgi:His-Xaa-Ser system protein HxsD
MSDNNLVGDSIERVSASSYRILFDTEIYSSLALKKAAYKFANNFAIVLSTAEPHRIAANITFAESCEVSDHVDFLRAFTAEVIDQDLREIIAAKTEATRNLILAEAFSKTSLLHEEN